jgi:hypothetical protein
MLVARANRAHELVSIARLLGAGLGDARLEAVNAGLEIDGLRWR